MRTANLPILAVLVWISTVAASCFFPNGADANDGSADNPYRPCTSRDGHSMCCNVKAGDRCSGHGFCVNASETLRESCTDQTWQDPACIKICINGTDEDGLPMAYRSERVLQCEDGSFCCGTIRNASDCCKRRFADWVSNVTSTAHWPTTTCMSHASVPSLSPTSSIKSQNTASRPHSSPSSTINPERTPNEPETRVGIIAGACLGGVIGILVLFGIIAWIVRRRRRQFKGDEDSVVILDHVLPDRTLPPSFRPYRVHEPPEVHWSEMSRLNERVVYVDKIANAVMDMGF